MPLRQITAAKTEALDALDPLLRILDHKAKAPALYRRSRQTLDAEIKKEIARLRCNPHYDALGSTLDETITEIDGMVTATTWGHIFGKDRKRRNIGRKLQLLELEMSLIRGGYDEADISVKKSKSGL